MPSHFPVNKKALLAKRNVWSEKPIALSVKDGKELLELAKRRCQVVTLEFEGRNGSGQPGVVGFVEHCLEPPVLGIEPAAHLREGGHLAAEALQHPRLTLVPCNRT